MGLLEDILARSQQPVPSAGFPAMPDEGIISQIQKALQRTAIARRTDPERKFDAFGAVGAAPNVRALSEQAGMVVPQSAGLPPIASAPPDPAVTDIAGGMQGAGPTPAVPLPSPHPAEADTPATDVSAASRRPAANLVPPAAPVMPTAAPPEPSMFGRLGGGLMNGLERNSNLLLAMGAGFAGAPNIGQAISRASSAAIPAHAADVKQQLTLQAQTYGTKALIDAGVPVQQAIAAAGDLDLKKALIQNYIVDRAKKVVKIGQDPNTGADIMAQHDPFTGKFESIDISKIAPGTATSAEAEITGPDYLASLRETNPDRARKVEAIINGDAPFPTGNAATKPINQTLIRDVYRAEPGVSASDFSTRQNVRKDYSSGNAAKVTKAVNTAITHGAGLEKAIADLGNFSLAPGITNAVTGAVKKQYDTAYQKARKEFDVNAENFVRELDFVISGGRPTVSGAAHQRSAFDINASPEENMAALRKATELMKGRLDSHAEGFNKGMRTQREGVDFVDPPNRAVYKKLLGERDHAPAAAAGVPSVSVGKSVIIQTPNGPVTIKKVAE